MKSAPAVERDRQKTTRNHKHHLQGNAIPAEYCHVRMVLCASGVNYNVNNNYMKNLAQLCGRNFTFWKISTANLRMLCRIV